MTDTSSQEANSCENRKVRLDNDQLERWAELIASGETPFPENLGARDSETLLAMVRSRRRQRLVRFIAREIAIHVHSARTQDSVPDD